MRGLSRLSKLGPGDCARVVNVSSIGPVRQRLLDMGLLPDVEVRMERCALGGDPIWISFGGAQLALRRSEAEGVVVSK